MCLIHYNSFCPDTQQCRKRKLKLKVAQPKVRSCCKTLFFSKSFTTNFAKFNAKLCTTCKVVTTWICFVVKKIVFANHLHKWVTWKRGKERRAAIWLKSQKFWMLSSHTFNFALYKKVLVWKDSAKMRKFTKKIN